MGINKVILVGNVGSDPEVRHLDGGNSVANFTLATNETYKNRDGQKVENTQWHKVVIWGKLVEVVESYVKKGTQLYIEGKIKTRKWTDKDGNDKYTTEIVLEQYGGVLQMLGSKSESSQSMPETPEIPEDDGDGLPF